MTTDPVPTPAAPSPPRAHRRPRQAPAARVLATGAALSATGILVAVMASGATPTVDLASPPRAASAVAAAPPAAPPTTIVIVHRPASATAVAAAPTAGRAIAAPRPAQVPPPVATSSGS
jgi:hypothetical protein